MLLATFVIDVMCMLNHCLEWYKWVLMNFDHDRQWFNTLIPPSHESAAVTVDCISRLSGPVMLALRYTTVDIYCRDRRYEWDGGMSQHHQCIVYMLMCKMVENHWLIHNWVEFTICKLADAVKVSVCMCSFSGAHSAVDECKEERYS